MCCSVADNNADVWLWVGVETLNDKKKHNQRKTGLISGIYVPYNYQYIHIYEGICMHSCILGKLDLEWQGNSLIKCRWAGNGWRFLYA